MEEKIRSQSLSDGWRKFTDVNEYVASFITALETICTYNESMIRIVIKNERDYYKLSWDVDCYESNKKYLDDVQFFGTPDNGNLFQKINFFKNISK